MKMTKTQQKRALEAILQKAQKLWGVRHGKAPVEGVMTTKDYMAIERIVERYLKKF